MSCLDQLWQVERFPPARSRTPATVYRTQGGGPAATAAVTAARLGASVSLWSVHGDDANGRLLAAELERYGVDVSRVQAVPGGTTPVSAVLVAPGGERFIFPYRDPRLERAGEDCAEDWTGDWMGDDLATFDGVLVDTRYPRLSERVLAKAARLGIPSVGDFADASHWYLAGSVSYLIASEECAQGVCADLWNVDAPEPALARLRQFEGQTVGVTLGAKGFVYDAGRGMHRISAPSVAVLDTTGAGDVFHGAYTYALARGMDAHGCARFATAAAALSCRGVGREAIPTLAEVTAFLESV
jgi:sulfofructose kinase